GLARSPNYPRGLPSVANVGGEPDRTELEERNIRTAVAGVLDESVGERTEGAILAAALYKRRLGRCLSHGWVARRTFLHPAPVHASVGGLAQRIAFVYASLVTENGGDELLATLMNRARLAPFLFASDGRSVLLGVLAADPASPPADSGGPTAFEVL